MRTPVVVGVYGRSLILASVGHRLADDPRFNVTTIDDPAQLAALDPDVVMIDLAATDVADAVALQEQRPDLVVVGLNGSGARLVVLGGRDARALGVDDLVDIMARRADLSLPST